MQSKVGEFGRETADGGLHSAVCPLPSARSPLFTCIVISHNKPAYVTEALASLAAQTFGEWEAIVFDSGVLYDREFFDDLPFFDDPRFRLVRLLGDGRAAADEDDRVVVLERVFPQRFSFAVGT